MAGLCIAPKNQPRRSVDSGDFPPVKSVNSVWIYLTCFGTIGQYQGLQPPCSITSEFWNSYIRETVPKSGAGAFSGSRCEFGIYIYVAAVASFKLYFGKIHNPWRIPHPESCSSNSIRFRLESFLPIILDHWIHLGQLWEQKPVISIWSEVWKHTTGQTLTSFPDFEGGCTVLEQVEDGASSCPK